MFCEEREKEKESPKDRERYQALRTNSLVPILCTIFRSCVTDYSLHTSKQISLTLWHLSHDTSADTHPTKNA